MKLIKQISLVFAAMAIAFSSCSDDADKLPNALTVDKPEVLFAAEGGNDVVLVSSASEWVATSSEPWLKLSPANGIGTTDCEIEVDRSLVHDVRKARIRITNDLGQVTAITVSQFGYEKSIVIEEPNVTIESYERLEKRTFQTTVTTNILFDVMLPEGCDWITFDKSQLDKLEDKHARPQSIKLQFKWEMNANNDIRVADVKLVPRDPSVQLAEEVVLTVQQEAAPLITDSRAGDSLAIIITANKLKLYNGFDVAESLTNWSEVTLWERRDEGVTPEMVGRVRSVRFFRIDTDESLPEELSKITYLESLTVMSNANAYLKSIDMGNALFDLKYLKHLDIFSYGLTSVSQDLAKLTQLETLLLGSNNFSTLPEFINQENFPNLKHLDFTACRRKDYISDLSVDKTDDMGLYLNISSIESDKKKFINLLSWDKLELLRLSNNYIEGNLPDLADYPVKYTMEDIIASNDSLPTFLIGTPKVLPNMQVLGLNLNMLTGELPDWLLYHPNLWMWSPFILIYNQDGVNTDGKRARFDNEPTSFEYYYELYPFRRPTISD